MGNEGSGTILENLKDKVLQLGGVIRLNETIERILLRNQRISTIATNKSNINVNSNDVVINTTSYCTACDLLGKTTNLKYRGVTLVYLAVKNADVFPEGVDFVYIDDPKIHFNRISDQNSFVKKYDCLQVCKMRILKIKTLYS